MKNLTTEEFIKRSKDIHGNKYNYSSADYINNSTKIKIICTINGVFEQRPDAQIYQKQGCPKCSNNYNHTTNEFINKSNNVHKNKYDYSLINYKNSHTKIKIICPEHGGFEQMLYTHLYGVGCPICNESKGEKKQLETFY